MHALMIAVMGAAMLSHSALVSVLGAVLLVTVSIVCAALSRSRAFLREHVIDLWAMALVLLVYLPTGAAAGHHAVSVPTFAAFIAVVVGWAVGRVWLALGAPTRVRVGVASAALTGAGLALMAVLCA